MANLSDIGNSVPNSTVSNFTWLQISEYTIFTIVFLASVTGNILVCLVIFKTPRMRTTRNYLLVNLAVSDLTVALLCIPFDVVLKITDPHWPLGAAMCNILWPAMTLVTNCSSATLAAISLDRYRAVVHPWKPRFTSVQTAAIIVSTWSLSFILVLPYALALKIKDGYCNEDWPHPAAVKAYTMGLFIFQYALPLLIITFAYVMVARKLRHQAARIARNRNENGILVAAYSPEGNRYQTHQTSEAFSVSSPTVPHFEIHKKFSDPAKQDLVPQSVVDPAQGDKKEVKRLERNTKITKMLVTVVSLYAICLLPNQVVWLWYEFGTAQNWPHFNELLTFGNIMVYINSCVNPFLYAGMNEEFRKGFSRLLHCNWKSPAKALV
ncbi:hypothetical protein ACROYT_G020429 [Oculina patagonica]